MPLKCDHCGLEVRTFHRPSSPDFHGVYVHAATGYFNCWDGEGNQATVDGKDRP